MLLVFADQLCVMIRSALQSWTWQHDEL